MCRERVERERAGGGKPQPGDPQLEIAFDYPAVSNVRRSPSATRCASVRSPSLRTLTAGHTPGGTSWSWRSCDGARCLDFVYADSQTPVSADDFLLHEEHDLPERDRRLQARPATLEQLSCDVLVTPHPSVSSLWDRVSPSDGTIGPAFVDRGACARYAATARQKLEERVERERGRPIAQ